LITYRVFATNKNLKKARKGNAFWKTFIIARNVILFETPPLVSKEAGDTEELAQIFSGRILIRNKNEISAIPTSKP